MRKIELSNILNGEFNIENLFKIDKNPVIITENGKEKLIIIDIENYDKMIERKTNHGEQ